MRTRSALLRSLSILLLAGTAAHAANGPQVCQFIATRNQSDIDDVTVTNGDFDINGDGRVEHVTPGEFGSVHLTNFEVTDEHGAAHQLDAPVTEDGGGYIGRWYVAGGRGYLVTFADEDKKYIRGVFEVSKDYEFHLLCTFENKVQRLSSPLRPQDKAICEASETALPPNPNTRITRPNTKGWRFENDKLFGPTFATSYDNAGTKTRAAMVEVESGAGRGCTYDYFAFAGDSGTPAGRHQRELLEALQEHGDYSPASRGCPNTSFSWFQLDGKTYLRSRPTNIRISGAFDDADRVNGVVDGVPRRICSASYLVTWILADHAPLQ